MKILPMRIYAHDQPQGYRLLVDRLWPRGVSKQNAALDGWAKTIAPTPELRKWFNHEAEKFPQFKVRYEKELAANPDFDQLLANLKQIDPNTLLLLYGAKDTAHNNAVVLAAVLEHKLNEDA